MKLRSTTPASNTSFVTKAIVISAVVIMGVATPIQIFSSSTVNADQYDAQIEAIKQKVAGYQNEANELRNKADTLQNTLAQLSADKSGIQAEIELYQTQYDKLVQEIKDTQSRIDDNKKTSGELIVRSSMSDDVPLIVRLAASNNLADYVEGEASRTSVRDSIVKKTEETEKLKKQLVTKQAEVKKVLDDQKLKRDELASKEATQQQILAQTRGDEAAYKNMISSSQAEIGKLQQQQDELKNRKPGSASGTNVSVGGSGGYPYANVPYPCWSMSCADPWGLFYRECVSYVAWKVSSIGRGVKNFGGAGHAYQWPSTTAGYTSQKSGSNPSVGDAAVLDAYEGGASWTGHVMYVERVNADKSIRVSEYNWNGNGQYGERDFTPSEYSIMTFITFPGR